MDERFRVHRGTVHAHIQPLDVLAYELYQQLVQEPLRSSSYGPCKRYAYSCPGPSSEQVGMPYQVAVFPRSMRHDRYVPMRMK